MIDEAEVRIRAEYIGLVHHQLQILRARPDLSQGDYLPLILRSSLKLGEIEWIRELIAEGGRIGRVESVLDRIIMYYEGYFEALARVLEMKPKELFATFDREKVNRLEAEILGMSA